MSQPWIASRRPPPLPLDRASALSAMGDAHPFVVKPESQWTGWVGHVCAACGTYYGRQFVPAGAVVPTEVLCRRSNCKELTQFTAYGSGSTAQVPAVVAR